MFGGWGEPLLSESSQSDGGGIASSLWGMHRQAQRVECTYGGPKTAQELLGGVNWGGEGLWRALSHGRLWLPSNDPGVYFVAGSRLTLFCKCSFPTMSKDAPLWSPLPWRPSGGHQPSCWVEVQPVWHFCHAPCLLGAALS